MLGMRLRTKVLLALVLSIALLDGVGYVVAHASFRDAEMSGARLDSRSRVASMGAVLEDRLRGLLEDVGAASLQLDTRDTRDIITDLEVEGFSSVLVLGPEHRVLAYGGPDGSDPDLQRTIIGAIGPTTRTLTAADGHLVFVVRTYNQSYAVAAALPERVMSENLLGSVRIANMPIALATLDGTVLARSADAPEETAVAAREKDLDLLDAASEAYLVERTELQSAPLVLLELVPRDRVEDRASFLASRFFLLSTIALAASGLFTTLLVGRLLRPLDTITQGARRLHRGDASLKLGVRTGDELQLLSEALEDAARRIAEARRQDALAAEEFEVAVGGLSRAVGEADTEPEIVRRLADAVHAVRTFEILAVHRGNERLELRVAENGSVDLHAAQGLLETEARAFQWVESGEGDDCVRLALALPPSTPPLSPSDERKLNILAAQASLALHRTRSTEALREAHQQLDRTLRAKEVYLDIVSHDLKNPIAVARGRVELLGRKDVELARRLAPIERSLERATSIIEEAVLLSRLETTSSLERPRCDLAVLASEAVQALRPLAETRGITLQLEADEAVECEANGILVRAIENLVSNALKWSPDGNHVEVQVEGDEHAARVRVIDHGPGIPPEDRPRLFARFERADRTGIKGTGLGLAIVKRVVDTHGGHVRIEETPGGGATFVLEIPRIPLTTPPASTN